jgi:ferredoxin
MIEPSFPSYPLEQNLLERIQCDFRHNRKLWAPAIGEDGISRLEPSEELALEALAKTTYLPVKKLLLPPREAIWTFVSRQFYSAETSTPLAVSGVALCDLQAVWYLDQVFADDERYQTRRANCFLVGMPCEPGPECRCDCQLMPLSGDLFIGEEDIWALSPAGETLLHSCGGKSVDKKPLPWPTEIAAQRPKITEEQFTSDTRANVWEEEAKRCLSCGACSAVCPTCYCFDMLDHAALDGRVCRSRVWDNCFFSEHGKIAGDIDFRPNRADRLCFRAEHKFFGFGTLRGQNSCVGCGRCRKVCPVDIDLDQVAERLVEESAE